MATCMKIVKRKRDARVAVSIHGGRPWNRCMSRRAAARKLSWSSTGAGLPVLSPKRLLTKAPPTSPNKAPKESRKTSNSPNNQLHRNLITNPVKNPAKTPTTNPSTVFPSPKTLRPSTNTRPQSIGLVLLKIFAATTGEALAT